MTLLLLFLAACFLAYSNAANRTVKKKADYKVIGKLSYLGCLPYQLLL